MIGDIAMITAAVAFAMLVILLAVSLWKLGAVFAQLERSVKELSNEAVVAVKQGQDFLDQVSDQLERTDSITSAVNRSAGDVSTLTVLVTATPGRPFAKMVTFSYVVRRVIRLSQEGQEEA